MLYANGPVKPIHQQIEVPRPILLGGGRVAWTTMPAVVAPITVILD